MLALGIDPGTAICGYGLVDLTGNRLRPIHYGAVFTDKDMLPEMRLKKIYDEIKEEAYKKALRERDGRSCVGIGCDGEDTINRVLKYFGLTANPQAPAEEPQKGVCVSLEDFL